MNFIQYTMTLARQMFAAVAIFSLILSLAYGVFPLAHAEEVVTEPVVEVTQPEVCEDETANNFGAEAECAYDEVVEPVGLLAAKIFDPEDECEWEEEGCDDEEERSVTIEAYKIVCTEESDLPNWGTDSNAVITSSTAQDWINTHSSCEWGAGWDFEWGSEGALNPEIYLESNDEAFIGVAGALWTTFGSTGANGKTSVTLDEEDLGYNSHLWIREVLKDNYLPYTFEPEDTNDDDVSAEIYCSSNSSHINEETATENYDNLDAIVKQEQYEGPMDFDSVNYCVAWNVPVEEEPEPEVAVCQTNANLLKNGSFEAPIVSHSAKWDIFSAGTDWTTTWVDGSIVTTPALELHRGVNGWLPYVGAQYAELDSDQGGPSSGVSGEPASVRIEQTVTTIPGASYKLSYRFSSRPDSVSASENVLKSFVDAVVDMVTGDGSPMANTEWEYYSKTFVADDATTTIAFEDGGTSNSVGTFLDDACLIKVADPEPEDDTLACTLVASKNPVANGESFDLTWTTTDADYVELDGVSVDLDGSTTTSISENKTYTLTAWENQEEASVVCQLTVELESNGGSNGGGGGRRASSSNNDDDSDDEPEGEVLGEEISIMPLGAANTGAGGTAQSTTLPLAFALIGVLASFAAIRATQKNG